MSHLKPECPTPPILPARGALCGTGLGFGGGSLPLDPTRLRQIIQGKLLPPARRRIDNVDVVLRRNAAALFPSRNRLVRDVDVLRQFGEVGPNAENVVHGGHNTKCIEQVNAKCIAADGIQVR